MYPRSAVTIFSIAYTIYKIDDGAVAVLNECVIIGMLNHFITLQCRLKPWSLLMKSIPKAGYQWFPDEGAY